MHETFQQSVSGPAFKIINERLGNVVDAFHTLQEAQSEADRLHNHMPGKDHFQIVEIKWCGGSKRLSDR